MDPIFKNNLWVWALVGIGMLLILLGSGLAGGFAYGVMADGVIAIIAAIAAAIVKGS